MNVFDTIIYLLMGINGILIWIGWLLVRSAQDDEKKLAVLKNLSKQIDWLNKYFSQR